MHNRRDWPVRVVVQELPEGTVTILFTDVEGSTELTNRVGDTAARELMGAVEALARNEIAKHRGFEVKGTGDGLMVAFQSARRAVDCATGIQQALEFAHRASDGGGVPLRIGLHTGDVVREDDDLFGATVNAAARIESHAEPGQVLISDTTRALLGTGSGITFVDRGEATLKGFDQPWRLWEVPWEPQAASERGAGPRDRTPYVGREPERERLRTLVRQASDGSGALVLIGGEAGVGKTRLSDELAEEARRLGLLTLAGQCHDTESAQPYLPFIEMVERAVAIVPASQFREALGDSAPELAKLLPQLRQRFGDIAEPIALPPEQEQRYLLNSLRDFLQRAARAKRRGMSRTM